VTVTHVIHKLPVLTLCVLFVKHLSAGTSHDSASFKCSVLYSRCS